MAVYEYLYDCPCCEQSESICVLVHFRRGEIDVQSPSWECGCALTEANEESLRNQALDDATDDRAAWLCDADRDARYDRWVDRLGEE